MSSDIAISAKNLSKNFLLGSPSQRFFKSRHSLNSKPVFNDVSFEVKKGETFGIVGRNGAGKSTLLQIICGLMQPSGGHVEVNGKVAALLELGAGFNSDFTGRENIYINCSLYGINKKETKQIIGSIIAFSEIEEYIDMPVRTYSSGMVVRLAFSVIVHVKADILIIDEALAVGDIFFQQKCLRFLNSFQKKGGTIIFVSHDTSSVLSLCERGMLLGSENKSPFIGNADDVCKAYLEGMYSSRSANNLKPSFEKECSIDKKNVTVFRGNVSKCNINISPFRENADSFGEDGARILNAGFLDLNKNRLDYLEGGQKALFFIEVSCLQTIEDPAFGFMIKNDKGEYVFTEGSDAHFRDQKLVFYKNDKATAYFEFDVPVLNNGTYLMNVAFAEGVGHDHFQHCWMHDVLSLEVSKSRLAHGMAGCNGLDIRIEVNG